jgi:hypothetical protein
MSPGLEMVADEHRIEAVGLGGAGEGEKPARPELLGGSLVAETQRHV